MKEGETMWPFGKSKQVIREEAFENGRKQERMEWGYKEEEQKKNQAKADAYFALSIYPSNAPCWACGSKELHSSGKVEVEGSFNNTCKYGLRRYLRVVCPRCGAGTAERLVNSPRASERTPQPEKEINSDPGNADSKDEESEGENEA